MGNKLFVGNISWDAKEADLRELFEQVGEVVEAVIIYDRIKDRSKGFGFVTMATDDLAEKTIEELNGKEFMGRELNVSIARPPKPREE